MTDMQPTLEARGIFKSFGRLQVLRNVDLALNAGRVTAVLGPNGSGKSTLNKTLLGLVRPDAGRLLLGGVDVTRTDAYRSHIGYMPQSPRFPDHLSARDVLAMVKSLRANETHRSLAELIETFDLESFYARPLGLCSGGQRQRVNASVAWLFDPAVLVLDEPTAGLDPVASASLKDCILAERERGRAILVTSHVLSELEELADDIVFLLDGVVRYSGTLTELRASNGGLSLERSISALMRSAGNGGSEYSERSMLAASAASGSGHT